MNIPLMSALTLIGTAVAASAFAQSQTPVNPVAMVNQFEATNGKFDGYRRSGAKGICATGEFTGSPEARALSVASVFSGKRIPVVARFSVGGANPKAADNTKSQRNMALQFTLPNGEQWLMGNISAPIFASSTPQQLMALLAVRQPDPATKAPDPVKVKAFNEANPEVLLQGKYLASQPVPASFASVNYWGVHAFGFTNPSGVKQFGKWIFEPVNGTQGLSDEEAKEKGAAWEKFGTLYKDNAQIINTIDEFKTKAPNAFSGLGADTKKNISKVFSAIGVPVSEKASDTELLQAFQSGFVQKISRNFPGSQALKELEQLIASQPNIKQ